LEGTLPQRNLSPIAQWLIEECRIRELSWAEASRRAGVDKSTISMIVRGLQPGLRTSRALAAFFGAPTEYVLRLAGRLENATEAPRLAPEILELALEVEQLPPAQQKACLNVMRAVLDAMEAAGGTAQNADAKAPRASPAGRKRRRTDAGRRPVVEGRRVTDEDHIN
jgi:transcriptional regulator with XRE-family HTH domain